MESLTNKDLGIRLQTIREYLGEWEILPFAEKLGVDPIDYAYYEKGEKAIPGTVLLKFIDITEANPKHLLKGDMPVFNWIIEESKKRGGTRKVDKNKAIE